MINHVITLNEITQDVERVEIVHGSVCIISANVGSLGVTSVNSLTGVVVLTLDEIGNGGTYGRLTNTQITDLTDGGVTILHSHDLSSKQDVLGFTPENVSNKKTTLTDSDTDYPTTKAVNTGLSGKQNTGSYEVTSNKETTALDTSITKYPNNAVVKAAIDLKVDKVTGKGLSTNDYTTAEQSKLSGIEAGAEVNNISDINATDLTDGNETTLHKHNLDNITDGTTYKLLTAAKDGVLNNTSGTNSGDNATNSQYSGLATSKENALTGAALKATIVDGDKFIQLDSESSNATSYNLFSLIKTTLKTYFDGYYFLKSIFTAADEIQVGTGAGTTNQITLAASQFLGKKSTGNVTNLTATEARAILNVADGANNYSLPTAAAGTLGGIKIGSGLSIDGSGVVTASGGGASLWTAFTATRVDDNTFSSSDANILLGVPVRYSDDGSNWSYGIVLANPSGTNFTLLGAPCTTSFDTIFQWGLSSLITQISIQILGSYADISSTTMLLTKKLMANGFVWRGKTSYIVGYTVTNTSNDTGANKPRINITSAGDAVSTANTNAGIEPLTTVVNNGTNINTTNYVINYDESIEVTTDANGSNDDAKNLTLNIFVVTP